VSEKKGTAAMYYAPETGIKRENAGSNARSYSVECFTLAWLAGLLAAFLSALPILAGVLAAGAVLLMLLRKYPRGMDLLIPVLCICAGVCGGILSWTHYDRQVKQRLCALDGTVQVCTGTVTETAQFAGDRARYTLRTTLGGRRVSVDWYADSSTPRLQIGDRVTLNAKLTRITSDYRYHTESYQAGLGRYLRIYDADVLEIEEDTGISIRRILYSYRRRITAVIQTHLSADDAALLYAMLFGDTSFLSETASSALYRTGIGHITAVSGLHLVFFGSLIIRLLKRLRCSARQIFIGTAVTVLLFAFMVDASVSVWRAAMMLMLSLGAGLCGRKSDALRSLCLVMFACVVCTPYVIGSVSFWLSVSGTFGVCILAPYMTAHCGGCRKSVRHFLELCCVSAAVFPASVLLCGESSLLGPVCNLLILPFSMAALYLGFTLLLTGGLTAFLLPLAGLFCRVVLVTAQAAAKLPFSHLTVSEASVRVTVGFCTVVLLFLLALRIPQRQLGSAALCAVLILTALTAAEKLRTYRELRVAVLGAEKQAALVISHGGHTVIADLSGAVSNAQYVQRYLDDAGILRVDTLILSDIRNAAAYQAAMETVTVESVYLQSDLQWREDVQICGVTAEFTGSDMLTTADASLCIRTEADLLTVSCNDVLVAALPADSPEAQSADVVIRWGGQPAVGDTCAIWLVPASEGNNVLLRISEKRLAAVEELG